MPMIQTKINYSQLHRNPSPKHKMEIKTQIHVQMKTTKQIKHKTWDYIPSS
jgi:hypothetical protein